MAISTLIATGQGATSSSSSKPATKRRPPKAERDAMEWGPPELGLRPSRYRLAERLYAHFARVRTDYQYRRKWEDFETEELRRRLGDADERAEKRASNKGKPRKQYKPRVRASELKSCARSQAMRMMGFREDPVGQDSPWWNIAAISGTGLHERIEIALKFLGVSKRSEFSVTSEDGTFSGRVDHELDPEFFREELGDEALGAILDVKTVKTKDFQEGCWCEKIEGYLGQVSPYAGLTDNPLGVILLVDRGDGRLMDFEWTVDPAYAKKMLRRASLIAEHAESRKLPKPEAKERGNNFECGNFCPFRTRCERDIADGSVQAALDAGKDPKEL